MSTELKTVLVVDDGTGIPQERLENIFGDFDTTECRDLSLGLAISRKIVDQFGDVISVSSTADNRTTVSLEFAQFEKQDAAAVRAVS